MEQNQHPNTCMCGSCGGHMKFHLLRWVLGILVIFMIFSFGVRIGEFKNELENSQESYPQHMMRYDYNYAYPASAGGQIQMISAQPMTVTSTAAKPVVK